jgi:predicted lactoylglutathione lyase
MRSTFVGLPTCDVAKASEFFTGLGFTLNRQASDERMACIVINEGTSVMLYAAAWFTEFTGSAIVDPTTASEVSIGVTAATRAEVDELTDRAVAAGGQDVGRQDLGYMYMRAFRDLDGHRWSFMQFEQAPQ